MKLVKEYINMVKFERDNEPLRDMKVGRIARIDIFMDEIGLGREDYNIREDLKIDVYDDVNIIGLGLYELPEDIDFGVIHGGFYGGGNPWRSLRGFPEEVRGDLQIYSPSNPIPEEEAPPKFDINTIKKIIKVYGTIWI